MAMFANYAVVVYATTKGGRRKSSNLGAWDDLSSDDILGKAEKLVESGKYERVAVYRENPYGEDAYTFCEWRADEGWVDRP